ncbi:MAG: hypothetical protein ACRDQ7_19180 [Haloechinothrix sp.]
MTGQLNTTVNGSSGTCLDGAHWLRNLNIGASDAADKVYDARNTAYSSWRGPASQAFHDSIRGVGPDTDDLAYTAEKYGRALCEFADALDSVLRRMDTAIDKATAGGLEVEGPFILPPAPVGPAPGLPPTVLPAGRAASVFAEFERQSAAHAAKVAEFNRRAAVFNECRAFVIDARNREDEAHADLRQALAAPEGCSIDAWEVGNTAASRVISAIGSLENTRYAALVNAERLGEQSTTYQKWAMGTLSDMSEADRKLFYRAAAKAQLGMLRYQVRVNEFESYVKGVPEKVRKALAYYPGKSPDMHVPRADASPGMKAASQVLRRLPAVGSGLVIFNESVGAAKGEQTWTKAAVDSGAVIGGGALGSAAALAGWGAATGSAVGPVGTVVVGGGGAVLGAIGGEAVVDFFTPGEDPHPAPVEPMKPYTAVDFSDDAGGGR